MPKRATAHPGEDIGTSAPATWDVDEVAADGAREDFALEISRLENRANGGSRDPAVKSGADGASAHSLLDARLTPQRKAVAALSAIMAVLLGLVVILGGETGTGEAVASALGIVAPTLPAGADGIYFTDTVPWGSLAVDGRSAPLASAGFGDYSQIHLSRGSHALAYTAAPFPTLRCELSVPAVPSDTCPLARNYAISPSRAILRTIDLQAIPGNLPDEQYAALAQTIAATLTIPDGVVQPGDHFVAASGQTVAAPAPLTAHLLIAIPASGTASFGVNEQSCDPLCAIPDAGPQTPAQTDLWPVGAHVTLTWQIRDGAGRMVAASPAIYDGLLTFGARWSGAWSVAGDIAYDVQPILCSISDAQIRQLIGTEVADSQGYSSTTEYAQNPANGCLVKIKTGVPPTISPPSGNPPASVFYRFGAFIATDSATQRALPQLPLASANERAIIGALSSGGGS